MLIRAQPMPCLVMSIHVDNTLLGSIVRPQKMLPSDFDNTSDQSERCCLLFPRKLISLHKKVMNVSAAASIGTNTSSPLLSVTNRRVILTRLRTPELLSEAGRGPLSGPQNIYGPPSTKLGFLGRLEAL